LPGHEIVTLDVKFAAERDPARPGGGLVGMVDRFELFDLTFRIIVDHDFQWPKNCHAPLSCPVEDLADGELQHGDVHNTVGLGNADAFDEFPDRGRRNPSPLHPGDSGHARIVPARHMQPTHEFG
jgi:hypothetical protein